MAVCKKIQKRWIVVCFLISCILLSGCRKETKTGVAEPAEYETAALFSDVSFWEPPLWDATKGTIMGDISAKTGLTLDINVPTQDADTQLSLMLINDELPDIISVTDPTVIGQLVTSGKVWKLEDFFEKYLPKSQYFSKFPEDVKKELIKRDGDWYAIPSHMNSEMTKETWPPSCDYYDDFVEYGNNNAIIWNRSLLSEAGLSVENLCTQDQVIAAFEKVKNLHLKVDGEEVIPLLLDGQDYQDPSLKYVLNSFGAEQVDAKGNYKDRLLQPEAKSALYFLNTMMRNGYANPEQLTVDNQQIKSYIASGRVLCFIGNVANTSMDATQWVSTGPILSEEGKTPVLGKNQRATTGWIQTFISKSCEHPEEIASWIDYMTSEEGMCLWSYGYEGKDYTKDENGLITMTEEGQKAAASYSETGMQAWWLFSNPVWERSVLAEPEKDSKEAGQANIQTAFGRHSQTYIYDESLLLWPTDFLSEESESGQMESRLNEWEKGQIPAVIMAGSDEQFETEYKELIDTMYDLGVEKLDEEKNIQYKKNCQEYGNRIQKVN